MKRVRIKDDIRVKKVNNGRNERFELLEFGIWRYMDLRL